MEFEAGVLVDEGGELAGAVADLLDQPAEAAAAEGLEGDGDLEGVGPAAGVQGAAEQIGQARFGVVAGVEVVGAVVEHGEIGRVTDGEETGGDGLPAEFVQVEGDAVGGVQAGQQIAVAVAEEQATAVGGVHVEPCAVRRAHGRDLGEGVDHPGVGGAGGGGDEVRAGQRGEGLVEGGGVEGTGRGGHHDGLGQPEQPGGARQRVVRVGPVHQPHPGAARLPREQQGDLVGLGAAGGDQGRGHLPGRDTASAPGPGVEDLPRERSRHQRLQFRGARGLVPGVEGGVQGGDGEVGRGGEGEGRAVEVGGAEGVGGVGGGLREGADDGVQGVRLALVRQYVPDRGPHPRCHGVRPARGQGPLAQQRALAQRVEHGVQQRPQGVGTFGA